MRADLQQHEPSAARAYSGIKQAIVSLEFEPGAKLSESMLAQRLEVSRTPVREALIRLASEGLVDIIPQHGTVVSAIRRDILSDAIFAREALETEIVREACRKRTTADIRALRTSLRKQAAAAKSGNYELLYELDDEMHHKFACIARRPNVWQLVSDVKVHMDRARRFTFTDMQVPRIVEQHTRIVDAIEEGQAEAASAVIREHLRYIIANFDVFFLSSNPPLRPGAKVRTG